MTDAGPDVTVVVPVYNAAAYLPALLDSLAGQDIGAAQFAAVLVNDGSTDGSGALLDDFATRHANVRVIHQDHDDSGTPGRPRNVGIRASTGRYVFFADADDVLAPSCLRDLVAFADTHRSDVVIPKLTPMPGRSIPSAAYRRTLGEADLETAFRSLFTVRLIRRQFLGDHDLWYTEAVRQSLCDAIFNAHAYVHARRISVLADGDYYFVRARADGQVSLSKAPKTPSVYTAGVAQICEIIRWHVEGDLADRLVLDIYRRKCLNQYTDRFAEYDCATQEAWITAHRALAERFVPEGLEQRLQSLFRERAHLVRRGDREGLLELRAAEKAPAVAARVVSAAWGREGLRVGLEVSVSARLGTPRQITCSMVPRDGDGHSAFPMLREGSARGYGVAAAYVGWIPESTMDLLVPGTYDIRVVSETPAERLTARVLWPAALPPPAVRRGFAFFGTKGGNASVRKTS